MLEKIQNYPTTKKLDYDESWDSMYSGNVKSDINYAALPILSPSNTLLRENIILIFVIIITFSKTFLKFKTLHNA